MALHHGDNLQILPTLEPASVDLCYLDPPFFSQRDYHQSGRIAFEDRWRWDEDSAAALERLMAGPETVARVFESLDRIYRTDRQRSLLAYLVSLGERLLAIHPLLRRSASLYLHCDSTASHALRLVLDAIFEPAGGEFLNEIVWRRAATVKGNHGQGSRRFDPNTDTLLLYARTSGANTFHPQFAAYDPRGISRVYRFVEEGTGRRYQLISMTAPGDAAKGNPQYDVMGVRRFWRYSREEMQRLIDAGLVVQTAPGNVPRRKQYLDEGQGVPVESLWSDIPGLHAQSAERCGYPTQKPEALLERVILASSDPGDLVLDPYCGSGTTLVAAQRLGRRWIGIDSSELAIAATRARLDAVAAAS